MVTTRRQSGAVSKADASKVLVKDISDSEEDPSASEEEVDYEPRKTRRKPAAPPKAKRQKTKEKAESDSESEPEEAPAALKAPKRRRGRGKDLSLLVTMPLNILYEILSQLSPKDLLNVSKTNKTFYKNLMAASAKSVWVSARKQGLVVPEPPQGISEARWAGLLFRNVCQACGASGVLTVDWMLLKRVCTFCKKTRLVYAGKYASKFPDYDKEILDYILYTNIGGHSQGHPTNSRYYWERDIYAVWKQWSPLQSAAHNGLIGAKEKIKQWKADRVKWVKDTIEASSGYSDWYRSMRIQNENAMDRAAKEHRVERLAAFRKRFIDAGYDVVDIDAALSVDTEGIHKGTPTVTNAVWTKLKPKLEPLVIARKEIRIAEELQAVVTPRIELFRTVFERYLAGLRPSDRCNTPAFQFLRTAPEIAALIDAAPNVTITANDFQPLLAKLPEHVAQYLSDCKKAIMDIIPPSDYQSGLDPLNMARFILQCNAAIECRETYNSFGMGSRIRLSTVKCTSGPLQGWPMVISHLKRGCKGAEFYAKGVIPTSLQRHAFKIDEDASAIATSLITLAGLNPMTATMANMDEKATLFVCTTSVCQASRKYGILNWRQAVQHGHVMHLSHAWSRIQPTFRLATVEEAEKARASVRQLEHRPVWSCNHCSSDLDSEKAAVLEHLRVKHYITKAEVSRDYFVNETQRHAGPSYEYDSRPPPMPKTKTAQPQAKAQNVNQIYQCLRCTELAAKKRRFVEGGVVSHIKAKHRIENPKAGVDYKIDPSIRIARS